MTQINTYITGQYNPQYNPTNQGFFRGSSVFTKNRRDPGLIYHAKHDDLGCPRQEVGING